MVRSLYLKRLVSLLGIWLLSLLSMACLSQEELAATAIASYDLTATAAPTSTQTATPIPTSTSTPVPTLTPTPEPTPTDEPTPTPEMALGQTMINPDTQAVEVHVGSNIFLEAPAHFKPEYLSTNDAGVVQYDAPGLHLFVNDNHEWQVRPFEEVEMQGFEVMYGAGGEYAITSNTLKAEERMRTFFVSWVQSEGNSDYRQEVLGSRSGNDEYVWGFLQENDLPITKQLKTPHADTNIFMLQLTRFSGDNLAYSVIPADRLGMILVMEDEWNNNKYGIRAAVEAMDIASGKLDVKFTPLQFMLDNEGRLYIVIINKGVPIEDRGVKQREFYTADVVFGGHTSEAQPEDPFIVTSQFETMLNILKLWQPSHTREYWLYEFRATLEEFNRGGGNAKGSYGAYSDQIEAIYDSVYLIEPVR